MKFLLLVICLLSVIFNASAKIDIACTAKCTAFWAYTARNVGHYLPEPAGCNCRKFAPEMVKPLW